LFKKLLMSILIDIVQVYFKIYVFLRLTIQCDKKKIKKKLVKHITAKYYFNKLLK
jgi:hypothetical protein